MRIKLAVVGLFSVLAPTVWAAESTTVESFIAPSTSGYDPAEASRIHNLIHVEVAEMLVDGHRQEAIQKLQDVLDKENVTPIFQVYILMHLGNIYIESAYPAEAKRFLDQGIALAATIDSEQARYLSAEMHADLAFMKFYAQQYREAIALAEQAVQLHSLSAQAYQVMGLSYFRLGRTPDAISWLEKAADVAYSSGNDPVAADTYLDLAIIQMRLQDRTLVQQYYNRALFLDDSNPKLDFVQGLFYQFYRDDIERAVPLYQQCADQVRHRPPFRLFVLYNLGAVYSMLNRPNEALSTAEMMVDEGFRDIARMEQDPDYFNLTLDPRFRQLRTRVQGLIQREGAQPPVFERPVVSEPTLP